MIINLRLLKQEGGYWDFKKQRYDKDYKQDMLHDIIFMANNIENRDAYIIIGIDEENDFSITGVEEDNNRRNT
ncbi:RNA-binding domain-containing protein [Catenibacterium mitsuokai]|uniref:RNA-binding domain-containing protein n=1 Tax=Catenibacterium mitsuokai TaxID=100886 RepID=UPI003F8A3F6A